MTEYSLLRQERDRRGWSRAKVEALTERRISPVSLGRWEEGKQWPRGDNIIELCKLYGKSAKELGLDRTRDSMEVEPNKRYDIIGTGNTRHIDAPQEGTLPMSDLVRRAIFGNLGSRLFGLIDTWPKHNYQYAELQEGINKAIIEYNAVVASDNTHEYTRRQALKDMTLVPFQLVGGIAIIESGKARKPDVDLLLKHCAAGITACWYLRRGKELAFVADVISLYIALLRPLIYSHSNVYRKASAELLSQSFMLKSHLGSESNVAFAEQAVYYGDLSEDSTTQALAYRRRAYEHWENKNHKNALLDAEKGFGLARSNKATPKIIRSITAASLALCQAACKKKDDATISLTEARTLFDPATISAPSMSYTESILTAISGGVYQQIGLWREAITLYGESLNIPDISALGYAQQRIDYAETEVNRDDKPRNMDLCVSLLTEAVTRAKELNSKCYIKKAREVYNLLRIAWPREDAIKKLGKDHFDT